MVVGGATDLTRRFSVSTRDKPLLQPARSGILPLCMCSVPGIVPIIAINKPTNKPNIGIRFPVFRFIGVNNSSRRHGDIYVNQWHSLHIERNERSLSKYISHKSPIFALPAESTT